MGLPFTGCVTSGKRWPSLSFSFPPLGGGASPGPGPTAFTYLCSPLQLPLPPEETEGEIVLSGNPGVAAEGPFAVDPESGFLLVTRALDREEQAEYRLQV